MNESTRIELAQTRDSSLNAAKRATGRALELQSEAEALLADADAHEARAKDLTELLEADDRAAEVTVNTMDSCQDIARKVAAALARHDRITVSRGGVRG